MDLVMKREYFQTSTYSLPDIMIIESARHLAASSGTSEVQLLVATTAASKDQSPVTSICFQSSSAVHPQYRQISQMTESVLDFVEAKFEMKNGVAAAWHSRLLTLEDSLAPKRRRPVPRPAPSFPSLTFAPLAMLVELL
jgi:hypothetical protein